MTSIYICIYTSINSLYWYKLLIITGTVDICLDVVGGLTLIVFADMLFAVQVDQQILLFRVVKKSKSG